ncbi:hypothetical protein [Streptomyces smyrnaeus]|uniref:hypothetical protein n=1 Tax=Streptomyces smyrnaeus TaxID=1387713 RepID=UPI00340E29AD
MNRLRIAACNFLRNGGGDRDCRKKMYALLKSLRIDVLGRMELLGCEDPSTGLWDESRKALGMEGVLAPRRGATAVYWNPETLMFSPTPDARWKGIEHWPDWWLHPAAVTLRTLKTPEPVDFVAASTHLRFDSAAQRLAEAECTTRFGDRRIGGRPNPLPAIITGDWNSYCAGDPAEDEPPTPRPEEITDRRHLVHRSYLLPSGERVMDDRPDQTLKGAGWVDAARHFTRNATGETRRRAIAATSPTAQFARPEQGPPRRIIRTYVPEELGPAITHAEVIDVGGLSDHRIVVVDLALDALVEINRRDFLLRS